ncbi:MAG: IS3 family transposase [Abditibacteriaceae bacterium]|jgi:transposase InsO family protein
MKYKAVKTQAPAQEIDLWCEALKVSRSAYYNWLCTPLRKRALQDEVIKNGILRIDEVAKGRYGYRSMHAHLHSNEVLCGRDRVLRLMRELDMTQQPSKSFKPIGTDSKHSFGYHPNLLKGLVITGCNQAWVSDTTYLPTEKGFSYQATVMDLYNREIIGWSVGSRNDAALVCAALRNALSKKGGFHDRIIHHSDRGSTYASAAYQKVLSCYDIKPSMSAKGNCYDNAAMESFFGRFKVSTLKNRILKDETEVRDVVFEYIEIFYNRFRKHSALNYQSPIEFAQSNQQQLRMAA